MAKNVLPRLLSLLVERGDRRLGFPVCVARSFGGIRFFSSVDQPKSQVDHQISKEAVGASSSPPDQAPDAEEGKVEAADDDVGGEYVNTKTGEIGGPRGPEPTRYGDWERGGRCSDF